MHMVVFFKKQTQFGACLGSYGPGQHRGRARPINCCNCLVWSCNVNNWPKVPQLYNLSQARKRGDKEGGGNRRGERSLLRPIFTKQKKKSLKEDEEEELDTKDPIRSTFNTPPLSTLADSLRLSLFMDCSCR